MLKEADIRKRLEMVNSSMNTVRELMDKVKKTPLQELTGSNLVTSYFSLYVRRLELLTILEEPGTQRDQDWGKELKELYESVLKYFPEKEAQINACGGLK